jgi:hypothetical protein
MKRTEEIENRSFAESFHVGHSDEGCYSTSVACQFLWSWWGEGGYPTYRAPRPRSPATENFMARLIWRVHTRKIGRAANIKSEVPVIAL